MQRDTIIHNGVAFHRYPNAKSIGDRRYYIGYVRGVRRRLHQVIWEESHGPIPTGWHIHHQDGNPLNNSPDNLICITAAKHHRLEAERGSHRTERVRQHLDAVRPLAAEWHRSPEGREWHREHGKRVAEQQPDRPALCEWCGKEYRTRNMHKREKYCGDNCAQKARRASGVDNEEQTCPGCGKQFVVNRYSRTTHCTNWCHRRDKASRSAPGV